MRGRRRRLRRPGNVSRNAWIIEAVLEDKRFAAGTQDIRQVIQALRQALVDIHNKVIADVSAMAKDKLDDAKIAVKLAAQNANAAVNTFKAPAVELITIGKGLLKSANDKVEEYSDKFEQKYDSGLEAIYKACRKAGDTIDTIKANVKHELDLLKTEADRLTNKANQVGEEVFQLIKSGFDEIRKAKTPTPKFTVLKPF